jgi:pimeloyl-ACP methyl ester carboxylesterase
VTSPEQPVDATAGAIQLIDGPTLAIRRIRGPLRPIVLIPDAGRDSRDWDDVASRLAAAGHEVTSVDPRGQGQSQAPAGGYDTDTAADDVATLVELLGYTGGRSPVLAGHGWGGNVAMSLAARRDGIAGLGCIDGGWLRPAWQYPTLASYVDATGASSDISRAIHTSLYQGEPRAWYPLVRVPVLLAPALLADGEADLAGTASATRAELAEAAAGLLDHRISWYAGAGHDLPRTRAARIADDLLQLSFAAEPTA